MGYHLSLPDKNLGRTRCENNVGNDQDELDPEQRREVKGGRKRYVRAVNVVSILKRD